MEIRSLSAKLVFMVSRGQFRMLVGRLRYRFYSRTISYGLRKDLEAPSTWPRVATPITIREIRGDDIDLLFGTDGNLSAKEREQRMGRRLLLESGIRTCYVAVTADGKPCFYGWLFKAEDNDKIRSYFKDGFPTLKPDEALFEFAYTLPPYRRKHIMPLGMALIAEQARQFGARYVIAFADHRNLSGLRRCARAGFHPYLVKKERCVLFRRTVRFEPLPEGFQIPSG